MTSENSTASPIPGPCSVQVVIDATEPHVLADWWAATLDWEVEPQDESFIRSMIDQGFATDDDTITHNGKLVWAGATAVRPARDGAARPRLLFQEVPEAKSVKNRIHLDVRPWAAEGLPADDDLEAFRAWLIERGATTVGGGQQGPHRWVTFADPEGNEFCV